MLSKFVAPLLKVAIPLRKNALVPLATMASSSAIDSAGQRKMSGQGVVRAVKGIILVILNEDMVVTILVALHNMAIRRALS